MRSRPFHMAIATLAIAVLSAACGRQEGAATQSAASAAPAATAEGTPVAYAGPTVAGTTIDVYKSPTCGCCNLWIEQLEQAGFTVNKHDTKDVEAVKAELKVPQDIVSCHTAVVNGYVIEGHVPIELIAKLVNEKPAIAGLGVAGMPLGAPGMEGYGRRDAYDVQAWDKAGKTSVFQHVQGSE